jgi:hypothetical protein
MLIYQSKASLNGLIYNLTGIPVYYYIFKKRQATQTILKYINGIRTKKNPSFVARDFPFRIFYFLTFVLGFDPSPTGFLLLSLHNGNQYHWYFDFIGKTTNTGDMKYARSLHDPPL